MRCAECGLEHNENGCPRCKQEGKVLIPEIVEDSNEYARANSQLGRTYQQGYSSSTSSDGSFRHQYVNVSKEGMRRFPTWIITFLLGLGIFFEFGFLVLISFLVFMLIGKGISFFLMMSNVMKGRRVNPWVYDIAIWGVCLLLVVLLG